jgi:peptidoglycan/LPS O-acetylase OafA/YrhL
LPQSPALLPKTNSLESNSARFQSRLPSGHRDFLDGIRAMAALWVVLSHLWIIPCGMNARDSWLGRVTNWTLYSHFAVDVFIVLSGFCLILPVARSGGLREGVISFFRRRARRILPPFYAALFFSLSIFLVVQALSHQALQISLPALLANVFLVQDVLPSQNIFNGPFWSIAVEWRIYFLFPLMVAALPRCGRRGVLLLSALAGGAATVALLRWQPEMFLACPWYLLLFAAGLCAGSLSAERPRRGEKAWCQLVGLLSLAGLAALVDMHPITALGGSDFGSFLPVIDAVAGVGTAAALLLISRSPQRFPLLSWRPLVTLGGFAYSLYLVHMPCLLLLNALVTAFLPAWHDPLHRVLALALALPLVIGLARLFFLACERPFIKRRKEGAAGGARLAAGWRDAQTKTPA